MKKKRILAVLLASAMALSLAACGGTGNQNAGNTNNSSEAGTSNFKGTPDAETYVVDLRSEPPELNSLLTSDVPSGDILRMVMVGLYRLDENDKPVPDLATETTISEDKLTYTMKLRNDAKWSNGEPVTAHDFVYAYQRMCDPATASTYSYIVYDNLLNGKEVYDGTKSPEELGVKAIDDYTLQVTFTNPIPYAEHLFAFASYYPINQKAYEEIGASNYGDEIDKIATNGAYKISEWVHNDHITLTQNEEFYDKERAAVKNVKYLMMKDSNARMNAFQGGQVDVVNLTGDQVVQAEGLGANVVNYTDNGVWYLQLNTQKEDTGLSNANIRKALSLSIDTQSLVDNVLKDGSLPAGGIVPTEIAGANDGKYREQAGDFVKFNPEEAKKALDLGLQETGLKAENLSFNLVCDDLDQAQRISQFLQEQWKTNLGINVNISQQPFKSRLATMRAGDFDMVLAGWIPDYNDPMTYLDMFTTTNGNNYGKYSSAEYDNLIASAIKEPDEQKRQELLIQAEELLTSKDVAIAPLYFSSVSYAVSDKVQNMTRTGFQEFDFTDAK